MKKVLFITTTTWVHEGGPEMERTYIQPAIHESVCYTFKRDQIALWDVPQLSLKLLADAADLLYSVPQVN